MKLLLLALCLGLTACNYEVNPFVKQVTWVAPSEREDNTALSLSEIEGYRFYCRGTTGEQTFAIHDGSETIAYIPSTMNYCTITTVDTDGRESKHSPEIQI